MEIRKNSIGLSLKSGDVKSALINLLNITKENDKLTFDILLVYLNYYLECISPRNEYKEEESIFKDKFGLIARMTFELKELLDGRILDTWSFPIEDPTLFKEPEDIISLYPNSFATRQQGESNLNILFLAANAYDGSFLKLETEYSIIEDAIQLSKNRDKIDLNARWAVQKKDLTRVMLRYKPEIAHFSAHGSSSGEIMLVDAENYPDGLGAVALGKFFGEFKDKLKCIILNACYSEIQAKEIKDNGIQYVIGMKEEIPDDSAIAFSNAFYSAIGAMEEIPKAFQIGINAIGLDDVEDSKIPVLLQ